MRDIKLRPGLLLTSALVGLAVSGALALPAGAACTSTSPASNSTVDCTGTSTTAIFSGGSNVTVNLGTIDSPGAQLTVSTGDAIRLDGGSSTINVRGSVTATGTGNDGIVLQSGSTVTLFEDGTVSTNGTGFSSSGVRVLGTGNVLILEASDSAIPTGIYTSGSSAHGFYTHGATVTVNSGRSIVTTGDSSNAVRFINTGSVSNYGELSSKTTAVLGGDGVDTVVNRGMIISTSGGTAIELRSGNDTLILGEGSTINGSINGGDDIDALYLVETGSEDSNFLNFETLTIEQGDWVLSGTSSFTTIIVNGELINRGTLSASGGLSFAGSDSALINVGTLNAALTGGSDDDILANFGTINGSVDLGDGEDQLTLGTASGISGTIDGGEGNDILALVGSGSEDGAFSNFEMLIVDGSNWSLSGNQGFSSIDFVKGTLTLATAAFISGTLSGNGTLNGNVTSTGTVSPGNSVGTLTINGDFVQDGGSFLVEFDSSGVDLVTVSGSALLLNSPLLNIVSLDSTESIYGVILHADGGISGSFAAPPIYSGNNMATVLQTDKDVILVVMDGTAVEADRYALLRTTMSFFDQMGAEYASDCEENETVGSQWRVSLGLNCQARIWTRGFGELGRDEPSGGDKPFDYSIGGIAAGADAAVGKNARVGASFGYAKSAIDVEADSGQTSFDSFMGSLHGRIEAGGAFLSGTVGAGQQLLDLFRTTTVGSGAIATQADTTGWLAGAGLMAGLRVAIDDGWSIAPKAGISYLHQWVEKYEEEIGTASILIDEHDTGFWRVRADIEGRYDWVMGDTHFAPHVKLGWVREAGGGGTAAGSFSTGDDFKLNLEAGKGLRAVAGLGFDLTLTSGVGAFAAYEGEASRTSAVHSLRGGVTLIW